jgi:hypothetical protein
MILNKDEHSEKQDFPIEVTEFEILRVEIEVYPEKQ